MSKTKQADGEIHEDQLLNFLVNRLDEEVTLSLANNAEITAEDIYEVLVGACADGTSVSTLCASSQNTPAANTILYHLRTKFEPERLERVANTLLRKDLDELLPEQVEVCADLHLLGEQFIEIFPKERVSDSFEPFRLELRPKMVEDRVRSGCVLARSTERRD